MRHRTLAYLSSYDRGLQILLTLWPKIIEKYPDATLHIAYGWDLFTKAYIDNPERMAWKSRMDELMKQKGITHHGRLGKKELGELRKRCGIWAYPTFFDEIFCITAVETQHDGMVPCTVNDFALAETVGAGVKVDGDIYDKKTQQVWLDRLFELMGDEKLWEKESKKAIEYSKQHSWDAVAKQWEEAWK